MSSINRRRNGLMALSVIGAPVLGEVQGPSISRQDACFCYSPRPFPCYKLPRERFSPSAQPRRCRAFRRRFLHHSICRPSPSCVANRWFATLTIYVLGSPEHNLDGGEGTVPTRIKCRLGLDDGSLGLRLVY